MQSVTELYDETMKFNNFLYPEEVKIAVQELASQKMENNQRDLSKLIKAISIIIENKKCYKQSLKLISGISNLILSNEIPSISLVKLLKSFNVYSSHAESEQNLKLLQFYSTLLPKYINDKKILQMLFSNSIGLTASQITIVATTAFATSLQMITLFINYAQNSKLTDKEIKENDLCNIDKNGIIYMIFHDISALLLSDKLLWLNITKINRKILFGLWGNIIQTHKLLICSQPYFLELVENSIILPIVEPYEIKFLIVFINNYMDILKDTSISIFSYFLCSCNYENQLFFTSLRFFRILFLYDDFLVNFLVSCEGFANLIDVLLDNFLKIESFYSDQPIRIFKISKIKINNIFISSLNILKI